MVHTVVAIGNAFSTVYLTCDLHNTSPRWFIGLPPLLVVFAVALHQTVQLSHLYKQWSFTEVFIYLQDLFCCGSCSIRWDICKQAYSVKTTVMSVCSDSGILSYCWSVLNFSWKMCCFLIEKILHHAILFYCYQCFAVRSKMCHEWI